MPKPTDLDLLVRIGKRVREIRVAASLSQQAVAEGAGMEPPNLSRIESGELGL